MKVLMQTAKKVFLFPLTALLVGAIWFYKSAISPNLGKHCAFTPTCSTYALQSIRAFGPIVGFYVALKRIVRCNPTNCGGFDPVPINIKGEHKWIL